MILFKNAEGFEWDRGNQDKNYKKHRVSGGECEEVFFDPHRRFIKLEQFVEGEERHVLIGETKKSRLLFVVFTVRKNKIRVISARDLNRKERHWYEEKS